MYTPVIIIINQPVEILWAM